MSEAGGKIKLNFDEHSIFLNDYFIAQIYKYSINSSEKASYAILFSAYCFNLKMTQS